MEFSGTNQDRQVTLRSYSSKGKMLWEHKVLKQEISKVEPKK